MERCALVTGRVAAFIVRKTTRQGIIHGRMEIDLEWTDKMRSLEHQTVIRKNRRHLKKRKKKKGALFFLLCLECCPEAEWNCYWHLVFVFPLLPLFLSPILIFSPPLMCPHLSVFLSLAPFYCSTRNRWHELCYFSCWWVRSQKNSLLIVIVINGIQFKQNRRTGCTALRSTGKHNQGGIFSCKNIL